MFPTLMLYVYGAGALAFVFVVRESLRYPPERAAAGLESARGVGVGVALYSLTATALPASVATLTPPWLNREPALSAVYFILGLVCLISAQWRHRRRPPVDAVTLDADARVGLLTLAGLCAEWLGWLVAVSPY